ncbi:MAG: acetyltransferase [Dehalococcoidales bacterium]
MKKILIVGAGGFGREVYNWIDDSASQYPGWKILGFLDDDASCLEGYNYPLPIISTVEGYVPQKDEYLIMAIGNSQTRCVIVDELKRKNAQFETLIHKSARLGKNVEMGEGCIICPDVIITCDVSIGDFVIINCKSDAGHDSEIGDFSTLSAYVGINGFNKIGKRVEIGSHACFVPGLSVVDDVVIGAGAVVAQNITSPGTYVGVPAKRISISG